MSSSDSAAASSNAQDKKPDRLNPKEMEFVVYQGMMLPQLFDPVEVQVQKVKDMEIRDSDVLLCSYPKSGTHWLWRILDMLVSGSADYSNRILDHTALDMQSIDKIQNLDSPRVLCTHYPFDLLPDQVKAGKVKVVHVYRDPKAVMVSLFFQMQNVGKFPDVTLQQLEGMLFAQKAAYGNMFYYFDKVKEFQKLYPDVRIYHISYEELKKDTAGSIQKLAAYLKLEASDELCSQIAEAVSFNKQKKEEESRSDGPQLGMKFYRKGEVSDWKNHLTVAQSERFDQVLSERADTCRFSARYRP